MDDTVAELCKQLRARVDEHDTYGFIGFVPSGSVAKRTAIRGSSDVDVAAYLRVPPEHSTTEADVLQYLRDRLREVYREKEHDITEGNHAVRVHFHDATVKVDVVPIISDGAAGGPGWVWDRDADNWIETDIGGHVGAIARWKQKYPRYCEFVRLTKWWRKSQPELRFRSFLIEILWGFLLDKELVDASDMGEAMLGLFAYVARTGLREPIVLTSDSSPVASSDPILISDPAMPTRNAARNVDAERRDAFVQACREGLEQLAIAQTAVDRATATEAYRALFGPEFPEVPNRELDHGAGSTDDSRRAAARIHADLRQLRAVSSRFSPSDEEVHAQAVRLWVKSGYVDSIELAFCNPGTTHRRFSARYHPAAAAPKARTAGFAAPDLRALSFRIYVHGNSGWSALEESERQAFRGSLPGTWRASERLQGGTEGEPAHIGGGELGVVRSVIR